MAEDLFKQIKDITLDGDLVKASARMWQIDIREDGQRIYGDDNVDKTLDFRKNPIIKEALNVLYSAEQNESSDVRKNTRIMMEKSLRVLYYAQHVLYSEALLKRAVETLHDVDDSDEEKEETNEESDEQVTSSCLGISMFEPVDTDPKATTGFQKLLLYLLYTAWHRQIRKQDDMCFRKIIAPGGYDTHAWEPCYTIKDFIYETTMKEFNFDMWKNLTRSAGGIDSAASYLKACKDPQFPKLQKSRDVFSFSNGIYFARTDKFVPYVSGEQVDDSLSAAKYFPQEFQVFDSIEDWYEIPTPTLQHIMDDQEFPKDACRWLYVFIGRLIYPLNSVDQWQVIPFLQGQAATGKSTVLMNVCKNLYETVDVGVMSNNIEKKFGLAAFADKFLFIAPEVRHDLGLDQAEFQSMVSGEDMCVAKKFETAQQFRWTVPGILAGNQVPNWNDNARSIARRLVVWEFLKRPMNPDTRLGDKLHDEMPRIILKANKAYLDAVKTVNGQGIHKHLAEYFKGTNASLVDEVDSLRNFLDSGKVSFGPEYYMSFSEFTKEYNQHCAEQGFKKEKLSKATYTAALFERNVRVNKESLNHPPKFGAPILQRYVMGLCLVDNTHYWNTEDANEAIE
jgi:hypothetical protein